MRKYRYAHIRPNTDVHSGGLTIAFEVDDQKNIAYYALAWCSKTDTFNRSRGRQIATGRLDADKSFVAKLPNTGTRIGYKDTVSTILDSVYESKINRKQKRILSLS